MRLTFSLSLFLLCGAWRRDGLLIGERVVIGHHQEDDAVIVEECEPYEVQYGR